MSPKLRYLHTNRPTLLSFCKPPIALACAFANPWHNAARFGITGKKHIFALAKEEGLGLFLFSHIRGLTILYERKIYLIGL